MNFERLQEFRRGVLHGLAWVLIACFVLVLANVAKPAEAAESADTSALLFPVYEASEVLNATALHHHARHTAGLSGQLKTLDSVTGSFCEGGRTNLAVLKAQYSATYLAWLELSAVVMGPMLANNTVRQLDFRPLRVNLLERAIQKQPRGAQDMALVGSPAKGFPALEYLLDQPGFKPATVQCAYAREVVQDLARVVDALAWPQVENLAADEPGNPMQADMQLYFNQLVGAVHNLAWERMEKSLLKTRDEAATGKAGSAPLGAVGPVGPVGVGPQAWAVQWRGIETLLVLNSPTVPDARRQLVPLQAYLMGLGKIELADTLSKHCKAVDMAMRANNPSQPERIEQSIRALKALKTFLEQDVAKGLKVSIQFSSSDGD